MWLYRSSSDQPGAAKVALSLWQEGTGQVGAAAARTWAAVGGDPIRRDSLFCSTTLLRRDLLRKATKPTAVLPYSLFLFNPGYSGNVFSVNAAVLL